MEKKYSDLDVVVEFRGNEREDGLFNLFHEDKFSIGGMRVDINPITKYKSGTLEEYLPGVEKYLEEKCKRMSVREIIREEKVGIREQSEKAYKGSKEKGENVR